MASYITRGAGDAGIAILVGLLVGLVAASLLPAQARPQTASAATECPAANDKGAYFERGRDDEGNAICGFAWYNACPYTEAVPADDPMCKKAQVSQEQPKKADKPNATKKVEAPATSTVSTCGGK